MFANSILASDDRLPYKFSADSLPNEYWVTEVGYRWTSEEVAKKVAERRLTATGLLFYKDGMPGSERRASFQVGPCLSEIDVVAVYTVDSVLEETFRDPDRQVEENHGDAVFVKDYTESKWRYTLRVEVVGRPTKGK